MLHQSLAWFVFDARCVGYLALLHWAVGRPIPLFYHGRPAPATAEGLR